MNFKAYRRRTEYDRDKINKRDNFIFLNSKYCLKNQTVLAGDSITEIFNMELFNEYVKASGQFVYNRGISGDTSDRLCERFDETVLALEPKKLVLLIGTNDLTLINDVEYIFSNIEQIVAKTRSELPQCRILLQSVYPVHIKRAKKNKNILKLNALLKTLADKYDVTYLDIHTLLRADDGGFDERYTYDGLHPNAPGFEVVAGEIIKALI